MKKLLSLLLALCLCIGLCACSDAKKADEKEDAEQTNAEQKEAKPILLPEGLEFGMSFEEVNAWDQEDGIGGEMELENGSTPGTYVADMLFFDMIGFYGFDTDNGPYPLYGHAMFSFNSNKEMYEFYGGGWVEGPHDAQQVFDHIVDYYEGQMNKEATHTDDVGVLIASLENKDAAVEVHMYSGTEEYQILVVIHNFEYDLN